MSTDSNDSDATGRLLERIVLGDRTAFGPLFERHNRLARQLVNPD